MTEENQRSFNPREHLLQLKSREGSKDYLPVQWRLVWFREQCPQGTIETEIVHLDLDKEMDEETFAWNSEKRRSEKVVKTARGVAIVRAVVRDGKGGVATGTKMEKAASFPDWLEKAETGAIGRALAALGYGTQFAPDLDEAHRIVDAPVDRPNEPSAQPTSTVRAPEPADLRRRSIQLGINPEQLVMKVLKANVPEDNWTPEMCARLARGLDIIEESRSKKAS